MNGVQPPESLTSEPVPLAVLARARTEVVGRLRKRLLIEIVAAIAGVAAAVAVVMVREHQSFPFALYALPTLILGLVIGSRVNARIVMNKGWLLRPSRRRASAEGYANRLLWRWGRRRTYIWIAAVLVLIAVPPVAAAFMGFLMGIDVAGLISLRTKQTATGVQDVDPQVFGYYAQHQDDPIFTAPLTSVDAAGAPRELPDAPAFVRPPRKSWGQLAVKPTAGRLTSLVAVGSLGSLALIMVAGTLYNALPENGHEALGWLLFTTGTLAFLVALILLVTTGVVLALRPRSRRRELAAGYCTDPVETLKELLVGAPSAASPANS